MQNLEFRIIFYKENLINTISKSTTLNYLFLNKKIGNKALLFGAIGGSIPDLDVFVGDWLYDNEIQAIAFHRGFMHSIFFAIFASLAMGCLMHCIYNRGKRHNKVLRKGWIQLFFWSIFTHPILDCFTAYGTQLFAPFSNYRVAFDNISVADVVNYFLILARLR